MGADGEISVLIVDDQPIVRTGLATLVASQPDLLVVGEVGNGREAIDFVECSAPDVVLMDIRMPEMDGIEATRRIATNFAGHSHTRVVILTTYDLDEYVYDALNAGASGFLLKHAPPEQILMGIRAAADGGALVSPSVTMRLIESFTAGRPRTTPKPDGMRRLTCREREVFDLVVAGRTNAEISNELFIAESTVKTHLNRVLYKLNVRDRVHAVVYAYEHNLVALYPTTPPPANRR